MKGVEIPKSSDYLLNYGGIRLAKIIKINEEEFKLAKPQLLVNKDEYVLKYKPIERDISFWGDNELMRINTDYNNDNMWDKIKPYVALGIVAVVCMIMVISTLDRVGELSNEAKQERTDMTNLISRLMDDPGSVANQLQNTQNNNTQVETNVAKPPSQG